MVLARKLVCIKKIVTLIFHQIFVYNLLQHKNLYSIKLSLKFVYSRKKSENLYLILHVLHFFLHARIIYI